MTASDGLNTTPQNLTVTLTDVNDNAPVFTSSATPSVAENTTTVVSLAASDVDIVRAAFAAFEHQPDATAQGPFGQLASDPDLARKPAVSAPARADRPGEPGFHR